MKYDVWSSLILVGLPSLQYHASTSPPTASWLDMALFQIVVEHWRVLTSAWSCLMSFVCKLMTHIMCDTINSESMSLFCSAIGQVDKSRVVILIFHYCQPKISTSNTHKFNLIFLPIWQHSAILHCDPVPIFCFYYDACTLDTELTRDN